MRRMRYLLVLLLSVFLLASCAKYEDVGTVVGKRHEEARYYITVPVRRFDDEDWYLRVNRCQVENPDKCKTRDYDVTEDIYNDAERGYRYDVESRRLIEQ